MGNPNSEGHGAGTPLNYEPALQPEGHSFAGIASAALGGISSLSLLLVMRVASSSPAAPSATVATIIMLACIVSPGVGLLLGIDGLRDKRRKRAPAIIGVSLNGLVLWVEIVLVVRP